MSLPKTIASQFSGRFVRNYVRWKLRADPVYAATLAVLRKHRGPLFDVGCGVGLLAAYLRENGFEEPILGIDHDEPKIRAARAIASRYEGVELRVGDIRDEFPRGGSVAALDILHYFDPEEQANIIGRIADAVGSGGVAIIRDCVRDRSVRYRVTAAQERFSRGVRWIKADGVNFATREQITKPFLDRGFELDCTPMWGRTPFNNYLFVFRRPGAGTTNE